MALSYVIALARGTFVIDRGVRAGGWPKPRGVALDRKTLGLVGLGDVGRNVARRALACGMNIVAWDPACSRGTVEPGGVTIDEWPKRLEEVDFLAFTCALNDANRHMLNADTIHRTKHGVRIVNVARGPLIDEGALADALASGQVHSAALDVFETEPLPAESPLRRLENCSFGSHNASNTSEAVARASQRAMELLFDFLEKRR